MSSSDSSEANERAIVAVSPPRATDLIAGPNALENLARLIETGFTDMKTRFDQVDTRFDQMNTRFDRLEGLVNDGFAATIEASPHAVIRRLSPAIITQHVERAQAVLGKAGCGNMTVTYLKRTEPEGADPTYFALSCAHGPLEYEANGNIQAVMLPPDLVGSNIAGVGLLRYFYKFADLYQKHRKHDSVVYALKF